jgi:glutathione peroxidase
VNTASFCGFAPQFRPLEALNKTKAADGLTVIGMPSNDFNQEAATDAKVKELCELTYDVDFPMTGLTHVTGAEANPFYAWVRAARDWEPNWNFNKVLIGRDGRIAATFRALDTPEGPALQKAMAAALSAGV